MASDYQMNMVNKALSSVCGLATSVIVARYLGVVGRGDLAYVTNAAGLLTLILGLGLNQTFPYFFRLSSDRFTTYSFFARIFVWQACSYALVAALVAATGSGTLPYICLLVVPTLLYQQMESVMAGYHIRLKIYVNLGISVARVVLYVAMVVWWPPKLIFPVVISSVLCMGPALIYLFITRPVMRGGLSLTEVSDVLRFSWLPMFTGLLVVANYNFDTLMLKWLGHPIDLGQYAVATGIVIYLWIIPDGIKEVLISRVARSTDPRVVLRPLRVASTLTGGAVGAVAAVGWLAIPRLYGSEFAASYRLTLIVSLGAISMVYFKVLGVYVLAEGRRAFYFFALALAAVANAVVNLVSIPAAGAVGAAWTTVGSYTLTGGLFVVYFCRLTGIPVSEVLVPMRTDFAGLLATNHRTPP